MSRIDMNPGFDPGPPNHEFGMHHHRRPRKQVIESDPEDDLETTRPKYPRTDTSTPTYSMDTDISTLEAPTFTTLNQGPSQTMTMLRWDHSVNLIGKKVVEPVLHVCDKCQRPILNYGRLVCKHALCFECAQTLLKFEGKCGRCNVTVTKVEQASMFSIYMCSHGGSRYGQDGCRRTYLSERDLQAHVNFRHMPKTSQPTASGVPSAEAIAAATAALVAENHKHKMHRPPSNSNIPPLPNFSQPPPPVMTTQRSSSNLITVPIQDSSTSNDYWTSKVPNLHQPPPSYYQHRQQQASQGSERSSSSSSGGHHYSSGYEWSSSSRTGTSSGYHRR